MDFTSVYSREAYIEFFRSRFLPDDFGASDEAIPISFSPQYTQHVTKIGQSTSLDINVYEVQHGSENDPRVSLSRESFRLLAEYGQKRALILFISKTSPNYRLSLVTLDLKWEEGKKPTGEYSNPKRFSFFLGPDAKIHTPQQYLVKPGKVTDFEDLKNRFSIEVVNKDFYTEIVKRFTELIGGKRKIGSRTFEVKDGALVFPSPDDTKRKEFAVRLIGRLVFCWFLKKKHSQQGIPILPEQLLSSDCVEVNRNFYHVILEPLFFEVLNTPAEERTKQFSSKAWALIPFLNGGLFTPHEDDCYGKKEDEKAQLLNTLRVPDDWLRAILEVFETYNFTIDENTPVDIELSIEPEMLGRIFENLLAEINPETGETARKSTGSYYTPRPIVEYMVDESLKQYLLTKTGLAEEKISALLSYNHENIELSDSQKDSVIDALGCIKIIDPACGSGAFPMGILQKILLVLQKLDPDSKKWLDKLLSGVPDPMYQKELKSKIDQPNYLHKLGIMKDCIFGVDIQPIAIEISKLRCFLSLIVDEKVDDSKPNRGVEHLPNLEFKFVCANTLIGLHGDMLATSETIRKIEELKKVREEYLNSYGKEKKDLENRFLTIRSELSRLALNWQEGSEKALKLAQWNPFAYEPCPWFDPEWMFGIKGGFEIAIANPPYISHDQIKEKSEIKNRYKSYEPFADLYCYFIELSVNLQNSRGILCFITSNSYLRSNYGKPLREILREGNSLLNIINIEDSQVFEASIVNTCILLSQKKYDLRKPNCLVVNANYSTETAFPDFITQNKFYYSQDDFSARSWNLIPRNKLKLQTKIESAGKTLEEYDTKIRLGLATGANEVFIIADNVKNELIKKDPKNANIIKPILRGRDIYRYRYDFNNTYILLTKNEIDVRKEYPVVYSYLDSFGPTFKNRGAKGRHWTNLRACSFFDDFKHEKIIWIELSDRGRFTLCQDEMYLLNTAYFLIAPKQLGSKFLLGVLNSKVINFYLSLIAETSGMGINRWINNFVKEFPIPEALPEEKQTIAKLVQNCLEANGTNCEQWEREIDQIVYALYGLTADEIAIVEGNS